jgi:hypothetical protein
MKTEDQKHGQGGGRSEVQPEHYTVEYFIAESNKAYKRLELAQSAYLKARSAYKKLCDYEKPLLAELYLNAPDGPVEERKMRALHHVKYEQWRDDKNKAEYESDNCFYRLERARFVCEVLRSKFSFIKTVMTHDSFGRGG